MCVDGNQQPQEVSFHSQMRPEPRLWPGTPVTLTGEPGVLIANSGFGTVVVQLSDGRVIQVNAGQFADEIAIGHPPNGVLETAQVGEEVRDDPHR